MSRRGILQMGVGEISVRGKQELSKWLDRTWPAGAGASEPGSARTHGEARFFEGARDSRLPSRLAALDPTLGDRLAARAEAICEGRFDLLGYRNLSFGRPIDWHLDPISGRRAPPVHWSRIDALDHRALGDARLIWELNRHQWLIVLGQAYRLTGRERYADAAAAMLRSWMSHNPPGVGINWASSLESAFRAIAWCWGLVLMRGSVAFSSPRFAPLLRDWIAAHASHVARYLSHYFSPNTHLTGEALSLCYVGALFPELRASPGWSALGTRILVQESARQALADGVYFEQSTGYQRYTIEFYLHLLVLAELTGIAIEPEVGRRVQRMLDFLLHVRTPDGRLPQIGDADGGSIAPLSDRPFDDTSDLFSTAAVIFDRPDYAWAAGAPAPETAWLLGSAAIDTFLSIDQAPPADPPSRLFAAGGYAVMAGSWRRDAHHLVFDVGPLGCHASGAHGHADLLSIQCAAFGRPVIVDPGTYVYTRHPGWRDRFRATAAHSTLRIDGRDQAVPSGPFSWARRPSARLIGWSTTAFTDFISADHDAYPVRHRRTVVFAKPSHWIVVDDLEGDGAHDWEIRFQFAPLRVELDPGGWYRAHDGAGHALGVKTIAATPSVTRLAEGDEAPGGGWVSPIYGVRCAAPMLIVSGRAEVPFRLITLLVPLEDTSAPAPPLAELVDVSVLRGGLPPRL